jgi:phenylacetate-CoA ligase
MTRHDEEMAWAQMYTAWNWAGWRVGDPFLAVGGESVGVGLGDNRTWKDWIVNRWVSSGSNLTLERTKKLAASPHFHRYRFLYGYPSAIRELCDLLNVIGDRPRSLKGVVCTAEVMRPEVRKDISRYLGGVPVHDQYGMNDGGLFAAERAEGAGLYVFFVRSVLEIVDDSGRQITEMGRSGRALATCLTNYATPFVRYETGDQLHWHSPDTPASGIRWPRIGQVDGRTGDVIYLTSGRRIAMPGLTLVMRWIEGLRQYQFIQSGPNSVTVRLERGADFALSETEVVNYLRTKISDEIDWKIVWGGPELTQNQKVLIIRNDWLRSQGLRRPPMTTPA